jgi:oligoribonuclease
MTVARSDNLIWIDMEMTGLDPEVDLVLEVAVIVTDSDLNIVAEGPLVTVFQSDEVLNGMDEWNTTHHTRSGLVERVRKEGVSLPEAEDQLLNFLKSHVDAKTSPLCGNSVGQDRRFMVKYLPRFEDYFHYRILDVSTIKELARRWRPEIHDGVIKKGEHRALEDVRESIEELKYYRDNFFQMSPG